MRLLPDDIATTLPLIGATEGQGDDALALVRFFHPFSTWVWYGVEYDPESRLFYGLVQGFAEELGYFALAELEAVHFPFGLPVERDIAFEPTPLKALRRTS